MNEVLLLFLVLAALYLWECACWLPQGSVACLTWFGKKWRVARPGQFIGNQSGGFVFAFPLPPLGSIVAGNPLPFSVSPNGLSIPASRNSPAMFFPFADLKTVASKGRKILINGASVLKVQSPTYADFLARQISDLQKETAEYRRTAIEKLFRSLLETKEIEARWSDFEQRSSTNRWAANCLFFIIFVLAPLDIQRSGLAAAWLALVIGILAFTSILAYTGYRTHKHFFPASDDDRFTHTVTVLLAPATAIRARDLLSRRILETFHPLAIASVLCPPDHFREFAEKTLRELNYPRSTSSSDINVTQAEAFSRRIFLEATEKFLSKNKLKPEDLCRAPKPTDDTCRSYCPRCLARFTTTSGQCADCGTPLVAFTEVAAGKTAAARSSKRS